MENRTSTNVEAAIDEVAAPAPRITRPTMNMGTPVAPDIKATPTNLMMIESKTPPLLPILSIVGPIKNDTIPQPMKDDAVFRDLVMWVSLSDSEYEGMMLRPFLVKLGGEKDGKWANVNSQKTSVVSSRLRWQYRSVETARIAGERNNSSPIIP
jgi:hypothetical protein